MLIKRLKLFNRKDKVLFEGFKQMLSDFHNPEKLEHLKSKINARHAVDSKVIFNSILHGDESYIDENLLKDLKDTGYFNHKDIDITLEDLRRGIRKHSKHGRYYSVKKGVSNAEIDKLHVENPKEFEERVANGEIVDLFKRDVHYETGDDGELYRVRTPNKYLKRFLKDSDKNIWYGGEGSVNHIKNLDTNLFPANPKYEGDYEDYVRQFKHKNKKKVDDISFGFISDCDNDCRKGYFNEGAKYDYKLHLINKYINKEGPIGDAARSLKEKVENRIKRENPKFKLEDSDFEIAEAIYRGGGNHLPDGEAGYYLYPKGAKYGDRLQFGKYGRFNPNFGSIDYVTTDEKGNINIRRENLKNKQKIKKTSSIVIGKSDELGSVEHEVGHQLNQKHNKLRGSYIESKNGLFNVNRKTDDLKLQGYYNNHPLATLSEEFQATMRGLSMMPEGPEKEIARKNLQQCGDTYIRGNYEDLLTPDWMKKEYGGFFDTRRPHK